MANQYTLGVNTDLQPSSNLQKSITDPLNANKASSISAQSGAFPWSSPAVESRFFRYISIEPQNWDQLFPYRLLVIDTINGNKIVNSSSTSEYGVTVTVGDNIVTYQPLGNQWIFTLPISPQQLNITDQYAIQTTATLRGVIEEHSGLRFKTISAAGTMGVWPYRSNITQPPTSPTFVESLFGGTIAAATNVQNQITRTINTATSNHPANKPNTVRPGGIGDNFGANSTGYYHAMALQQFLEQYAEAKNNPNNKGWRLIFDIPKQKTSYVVTPMPFTWQQNVNKPMEVSYSLQFKAWRRIDLHQKTSIKIPPPNPVSPLTLQRVLNTISEARKTMSAATLLIGSVRSDIQTPLNVLRQTALFTKDLAGVALTAADLPIQLISDLNSTVTVSLAALNVSNAIDSAGHTAAQIVKNAQDLLKTNEGLSPDAVAGGQLGSNAAVNQSLSPGMSAFQDPNNMFPALDLVPLSRLTLSDSQQAVIDQLIEDARETTIDTLKQYRATILELALQLSNSFGTGSTFYSEVYSRPLPTSRIQPITLDEYEILKSLYDVIQSYDVLTSTTQIDDQNKQTNMDYVAGLADLSGIPFDVSTSKILAPVPFGLTMEGIALRYLGDAQRWIEIATLNNLRDPYIDENGFQLPLLSNATGRQITVSNINNIYLGQRVLLMSSTQSPSTRSIIDIDRLSDTSFLLTLDGLPNLDPFTIADGAFLQAYLPGTVNSQQKIFIPSNLPVPNDPNIIVPPSTSKDPLTGLSKVDWLLTDSGDVAVNNYGDFRFSSGITNIIQALKIKIGTQKGTVLVHPEFGLGIKPGIMNSDIAVKDIYSSLSKLIEEDPRFQGLDNLQVTLDGPTLNLNMSVVLAGQSGVFPINFNL